VAVTPHESRAGWHLPPWTPTHDPSPCPGGVVPAARRAHLVATAARCDVEAREARWRLGQHEALAAAAHQALATFDAAHPEVATAAGESKETP
jgi:hypothetical protein